MILVVLSCLVSSKSLAQDSAADGAAGASQAADQETADEAPSGPQIQYLVELRQELSRLGISPTCEVVQSTQARCEFRTIDRTGRHESIYVLLLDSARHTIYFYSRLGVVAADGESAPRMLARLADLNWRSLALKYEWHAGSGELRVSTVQHIDSNFDRRAFRVLVRLMRQEAPRARRLFDAERGFDVDADNLGDE